MQARARANTRTHAQTHARTHARTHTRPRARTHTGDYGVTSSLMLGLPAGPDMATATRAVVLTNMLTAAELADEVRSPEIPQLSVSTGD
jgi:hypothetical protein